MVNRRAATSLLGIIVVGFDGSNDVRDVIVGGQDPRNRGATGLSPGPVCLKEGSTGTEEKVSMDRVLIDSSIAAAPETFQPAE